MTRLGILAALLLVVSFQVGILSSPASAVDCQGETATIVGDGAGNTLNGDQNHNVIAGLGGDDVINGKGGSDTICGNQALDFVMETDSPSVNDAGDLINMGENCDFVYTSYRGNDTIHGGDQGDGLYYGGCGQSQGLWGGVGDDTIYGDLGDDEIIGGGGNDTAYCGGGTNDSYDPGTTEHAYDCEHIV